jgi:uncharacterized membrane protein YdfJ with MMPL/SSD domain
MRSSIDPAHLNNLAARAGRWSAQHRRKAIGGWLAFVVLAYLIAGAVGQRHLTNSEMGNGQSGQATRVYAAAFPKQAGEQVLVQSRGPLRFGAPAFEAAQAVVTRLEAVRYVSDVRSPLTASNRGQISRDRRSALVTFKLAGDDAQAQDRVAAPLAATAAAQRANPLVRIEEFGDASSNKALAQSFTSDFRKAEYTSLPITLLILLFAFGALVAAGIPLLLGLTAVLGTLGLIGALSHLIPVSQGQIDSVVLLIGLAVGVDYSMFYLRRKLEERHRGRSNQAALEVAAATSGRAALISGLTVMTAMAGMFLTGNAVFTSFAMATMLVVAVAIVGSMTVLPAVISKLGDKVEKARAPIIARRRATGESRVWGAIIGRVLRVPALSFALGAGLLIALALPALNMHTVDPGAVGLPRSLPIMKTYDRIQTAFPGGPLPAFVLGLAFMLLLVTFRSVVIPLTAIVLNLLSVGAAYGVLKLIFQDGYLRSLLGATNVGGVID